MAEREQIKKPAPSAKRRGEVEEAPATSEQGEKIKAELDDLLDEIDEVLETNAEDFVKSTSRRVASRPPIGARPDEPVASAPVTMPFFTPGDDPGPELRRARAPRRARPRAPTARRRPIASTITHGTTVRRRPLRRRRGHGRRPPGHLRQPRSATAPSRRCSRPTATPASPSPAPPARPWRWCKLFQLQLEHYEKVEGSALSASRARPTSSSPDGPQPPARRPCRAWPSCRSSPATTCAAAPAACSSTTSPAAATRRRNYAATGSGSLHAGTVVKLGFREGLDRDDDASTWPSRRCSRRPTRTPPPAAPTWSGASTRSSPPSPPTASTASPTTSSPSGSPGCSTMLAERDADDRPVARDQHRRRRRRR